MKQRNVAMVIFLSFITFGIYTLFWLNDTRKEMLQRGAKDIPSIWWLAAPAAVFLLLCILFLLVVAATVKAGANENGGSLAFVIAFGLYAILAMAWTAVLIFWMYKYCQAVDQITKGQTSFTLSFVLGLALFAFGVSFVWPGIIQDGFNKVSNSDIPEQPNQTPSNLPPQSPANDV